MKKIYRLFLISFLLPEAMTAQSLNAQLSTFLDASVNESSGLAIVDGALFTHNDSGGEPILYEIDNTDGHIVREVYVSNAQNVDWEELATDENYLYVGDFGNNNGNRQNLRVYKIDLDDISNSDSVQAQIISFDYADQTSFSSNPLTNFDAEAMIAVQGTLYLFTKNRGDFACNVYALPAIAGSFSIQKIDTIQSLGLITAATKSPDGNQLFLLGFNFNGPFLLHWNTTVAPPFSTKAYQRISIQTPQVVQMEALAHDGIKLWLSSEEEGGFAASLYTLENGLYLQNELDSQKMTLYPNPTKGKLYGLPQTSDNGDLWELVDLLGRSISSGELDGTGILDLRNVPNGIYTLKLVTSTETYRTTQLVVNR